MMVGAGTTKGKVIVEQYLTYEQQVDELKSFDYTTPPNPLQGAGGFAKSITNWLINESRDLNSDDFIVYPKPSVNLVFPYPMEEIAIPLSSRNKTTVNDEEVISLLSKYNINQSLAERPVSSLSGGEAMMLSFAKADAYSHACNRLVLCNPTHWINKNNYDLIEQVCKKYKNKGKTVIYIQTTGSPFPEQTTKPSYDVEDVNSRQYCLSIENPVVTFPEQGFPQYSPGKTIQYTSRKDKLFLKSPTLLSGTNGSGKTVFAKLLTGILEATNGGVSVGCYGEGERARLVMQNDAIQLFGDSPDTYPERVYYVDSDKLSSSSNIYEKIDISMRRKIQSLDLPGNIVGPRENPCTVLQGKIALVAARLAAKPSLLLIDEPAWCLSKPLARVFMETVIEKSHDLEIPVVYISHLADWWDNLYKSHLHLEKAHDSLTHVQPNP
jgi:ABC-2 type transport system ATP-binding protein